MAQMEAPHEGMILLMITSPSVSNAEGMVFLVRMVENFHVMIEHAFTAIVNEP
jgi:hypothetical protein